MIIKYIELMAAFKNRTWIWSQWLEQVNKIEMLLNIQMNIYSVKTSRVTLITIKINTKLKIVFMCNGRNEYDCQNYLQNVIYKVLTQ
jgi:hypothetical protein